MVFLNLQIQDIANGLIAAGYSLSDLPAEALVAVSDASPTNPNEGQLWLSTVDNSLSIYNGVGWQVLGLTAEQVTTLATLAGNVYTATEVDALIATTNASIANKQDTLVSGTNIKTINGTSILGSGNVLITTPMGFLNDLQDATITTPVSGQVLSYNGTEWVNSAPALGVTDHTLLTNIGTNTHADIDTALARLANTSGTNTGDQDLSGYSLTTHEHTGVYEPANANIQSHISSTSNPHNTTATQIGALSLAGGTMTGAITSLRETSVAMAANNIDLSLGNLFTKTITGATTLTVSNVPTAGTVGYFILQLTNGGSATVTWFSGVKWAGGTAPTLTASGVDVLSFYTIDAGSTWKVVSIQKDIK